jgi:DNA-directed RNA polymerase specialized sigma24 family protein
MSQRRERTSIWWDRGLDREGVSIREDVRKAAQEVWNSACGITTFILGDSSDTAELMDHCVSRVSRSLDARKQGLFSQNAPALLMVAFRRELYARAERLRRFELIGDGQKFSDLLRAPSRISDIDFRLDLDKLVRRLSKRNRTILVLRDSGYDWKEIAGVLHVSISVAKNSFWRELQGLREGLYRKEQLGRHASKKRSV